MAGILPHPPGPTCCCSRSWSCWRSAPSWPAGGGCRRCSCSARSRSCTSSDAARARFLAAAVGLAAVAVGTLLAVTTARDGLSGGALAGPLGYGNANGALCTLGTGSALVLALQLRNGARGAAVALAVALTLAAAATGSLAAAGLCGALLVLALSLVLRPGLARLVPWASGAAVLTTLLLTVVLGGDWRGRRRRSSGRRLEQSAPRALVRGPGPRRSCAAHRRRHRELRDDRADRASPTRTPEQRTRRGCSKQPRPA